MFIPPFLAILLVLLSNNCGIEIIVVSVEKINIHVDSFR